MIGAVLTQQTRWENVRKALCQLRNRNLCSLSAIHRADIYEIEELVRCTGFYRIKTQRLKILAASVVETYGSIDAMAGEPLDRLRTGLLEIKGVGAETADSILCYGFSRASFVIDAYTEKICRCCGIPERRDLLKPLFEAVLPADPDVYKRAHAHIVEYAKDYCGKNRCNECILLNLKG
jgi:endonuclease-3 related protein